MPGTNRLWLGNNTGHEGDYSVAANWLSSGVPAAADHVQLTPLYPNAVTAGLGQSAVALSEFFVRSGFTGLIGSSAGYLQIGTGLFDFSGAGESWIDLGSSNIDVLVRSAARGTLGNRGLYLLGSNLKVLSVADGDVGVALAPGETATIATLQVVASSASAWLGSGVTLTTADVRAGEAVLNGAVATCNVYGGTVATKGSGAVTTAFNVYDGNVYPESTGTIAAMTLFGGVTDFTGSGLSRTVTTLTVWPGATLVYDPAVLTITNPVIYARPIRLTLSTP